MSQKEKRFQPKQRSGGQKFGGKGRGSSFSEKRDYGRPAGSGFRKKFEGDRSDRPTRSFDRPRQEGDSRDKPAGKPFEKREYAPRDSRPPRDRSYGDKKPYQKREYAGGEGRGDFKPRDRSYGDKKPYQKREYTGGEGRGDFKPRDGGYGDKKPYQKREYAGGEGRRDFKPRDGGYGDKKPYQKREYAGGEGRRDFKPRDGGYGDKPYKKKDFGGKKPFNKDKRFDRPAKRDFGAERAPASAEARLKLKSDRPSYGSPSSAYLYGLHAVGEALLNPKRTHQRLLCTQKGFESLAEAWSDAQAEGITLPEVITVEKEDIDRLLPRDAVHQDVLLDSQPLEEISLYELLLTIPGDANVLVLDQVTDPHNIGAILRSAAAFGAKAVVMQKLHAPDITGTLAKSASGAVEHVPLVRETNLSRALEQLKQAGFFCIGLDEDGKQTLAQMSPGGKVALVLGAEGSGLRRLVAENCDALVKLPTQPPIGSLNVSNAAAVALYELVRTKG